MCDVITIGSATMDVFVESDDANPVCPVCGASGEDVVPVEEAELDEVGE